MVSGRIMTCLMQLLVVLFCGVIVKNWAAVLPKAEQRHQTNQLLSDADYNRQQQQQQQQYLKQRLPHQSYDTNDDVAETHMVEVDNEHDERDDDGGNDKQARVWLHARQRRELSDWLIAPNTRWCGRGNIANNTYNHLGGASSADKCCRKHDHCQLFIGGMSNRYELFNYRPYTLSHCNCDRRFRTCLKMANDEDAKTIGKVFFNMVQTQCFVLKNERVCQLRARDGSCEREHVKQKAYLRNNKRF